jgi:hypothetical protein
MNGCRVSSGNDVIDGEEAAFEHITFLTVTGYEYNLGMIARDVRRRWKADDSFGKE